MVQSDFKQRAAAPASNIFTRDELQALLGDNGIQHVIPEDPSFLQRLTGRFASHSNQGVLEPPYRRNTLGGGALGEPVIARDNYGGGYHNNRVDVGVLGMVSISRAAGGHRGGIGPVSLISLGVSKKGDDAYEVLADFAGLGLERSEGVNSRENAEIALSATADVIQTIGNGGLYDYDGLRENLLESGYQPHRYGDNYKSRMAEIAARLKTKEAATSSAPATPEV